MAEKYESRIGTIACDAHRIYAVLSNLNNLNKVKDLIPQDKVQEMEVGEDYIRIKVDGLGQKICIRIVDKEEDKTIKFGLENVPMDINFWIQLKETAPMETRFKLTLHADLPMMLRMMLGSKIQKGLDQAVDMMERFPYQAWG